MFIHTQALSHGHGSQTCRGGEKDDAMSTILPQDQQGQQGSIGQVSRQMSLNRQQSDDLETGSRRNSNVNHHNGGNQQGKTGEGTRT